MINNVLLTFKILYLKKKGGKRFFPPDNSCGDDAQEKAWEQ